jgi:hypothetical protein
LALADIRGRWPQPWDSNHLWGPLPIAVANRDNVVAGKLANAWAARISPSQRAFALLVDELFDIESGVALLVVVRTHSASRPCVM